MKKENYLKPLLCDVRVKTEIGFAATSGDWGLNTPGGVIEENPYNNEL